MGYTIYMTRGGEALLAPVQSRDVGNMTVKDYLVLLLETLWEDDNFTSKRPFGNSGWRYDIFEAFARAGLVDGAWDKYGYLETVDRATCEEIIKEAIEAL